MKLYLDKAMPVTDESVKTLSCILHLFYSKYNNQTTVQNCLVWFIQSDVACTNMQIVQDLFLRWITNENFVLALICNQPSRVQTLHDIILDIEKALLYNQFEYDIPKSASVKENAVEKVELNHDSESHVRDGLKLRLEEQSKQYTNKQIKAIEFTKYIHITFSFCDLILKYTNIEWLRLRQSDLYEEMRSALKLLFASLTEMLKNCQESAEEVKLLNSVRDLLVAKSDSALIGEVCGQMDEEFFHSIHKVINNIGKQVEDNSMETDEVDLDSMDMRYSCIQLLAAYCKSNGQYRAEISELVLDPKLYNFLIWQEVECAFQCIHTLIDPCVANPPLGRLNQRMAIVNLFLMTYQP